MGWRAGGWEIPALLSAEEAMYMGGFDSAFFHTLSSFGVLRQFSYQVTYPTENSCFSIYIVYTFDLMALVWGAGEIRGHCKVALMGASGTEPTVMPLRGMCIVLPATQGVLRALANPPWQGLVRSALGRRGKPLRRYVDFQLEQSVRGLSRSHMLFAAWGMTATELGSKRDNSKIHPKGICLSVYCLKI